MDDKEINDEIDWWARWSTDYEPSFGERFGIGINEIAHVNDRLELTFDEVIHYLQRRGK